MIQPTKMYSNGHHSFFHYLTLDYSLPIMSKYCQTTQKLYAFHKNSMGKKEIDVKNGSKQ